MRKYTSLIILVVFLFNMGGYYLWFSLLQNGIQKEIRQEIAEGLKDENISLIIVPVNGEPGICWIKPNKEFSYKGEMYDIVKVAVKDQKIYYYCLQDTKEKQLIANFNKSRNSKKEIEKRIKLGFNFQYFPQQNILINGLNTSDFFYASIIFLYKLNTADIHSPPPKSA